MSVSVGQIIKADDFNSLFTRIETVRTRHASASGQTGTLATTFSNSRVTASVQAKASDVSTLNAALQNLSNSRWINTTFTSGITVPSVGTLIQASLFNTFDSKITTIEGICANNAYFSRDFSRFSDFSRDFSRESSVCSSGSVT